MRRIILINVPFPFMWKGITKEWPTTPNYYSQQGRFILKRKRPVNIYSKCNMKGRLVCRRSTHARSHESALNKERSRHLFSRKGIKMTVDCGEMERPCVASLRPLCLTWTQLEVRPCFRDPLEREESKQQLLPVSRIYTYQKHIKKYLSRF